MIKTASLFALAVAGTLLVAGCAGSGDAGATVAGTTPSVKTVTVTVPHTVTTTTTVTATRPTPTHPSSSLPEIGSSAGYTYRDGLKVVVPSISRFTPSEYAAGTHPGQSAVKVTVELKNDTSKVIDATLATMSMTYGKLGGQADEIYDENIGDGFTTKLAPGRTTTAVFAFSVPPSGLGDLVLQVSPDFEHDSVLFEGSVK